MLFCLILEERPVILLYWFAAQQQTSTLRCQKHACLYSKFKAQSDELSPSFPKTTGIGLKFERKKKQLLNNVYLRYPSSKG